MEEKDTLLPFKHSQSNQTFANRSPLSRRPQYMKRPFLNATAKNSVSVCILLAFAARNWNYYLHCGCLLFLREKRSWPSTPFRRMAMSRPLGNSLAHISVHQPFSKVFARFLNSRPFAPAPAWNVIYCRLAWLPITSLGRLCSSGVILPIRTSRSIMGGSRPNVVTS